MTVSQRELIRNIQSLLRSSRAIFALTGSAAAACIKGKKRDDGIFSSSAPVRCNGRYKVWGGSEKKLRFYIQGIPLTVERL